MWCLGKVLPPASAWLQGQPVLSVADSYLLLVIDCLDLEICIALWRHRWWWGY